MTMKRPKVDCPLCKREVFGPTVKHMKEVHRATVLAYSERGMYLGKDLGTGRTVDVTYVRTA